MTVFHFFFFYMFVSPTFIQAADCWFSVSLFLTEIWKRCETCSANSGTQCLCRWKTKVCVSCVHVSIAIVYMAFGDSAFKLGKWCIRQLPLKESSNWDSLVVPTGLQLQPSKDAEPFCRQKPWLWLRPYDFITVQKSNSNYVKNYRNKHIDDRGKKKKRL